MRRLHPSRVIRPSTERCAQISGFVDHLVSDLLRTLSDPTDAVVHMAVEVIAEVCHPHEGRGQKMFRPFIKNLLDHFRAEEKLRLQRGSFIIR